MHTNSAGTVNTFPAIGAFPDNTASLTIYADFDASEILYMEDYQEHTVLSGLASLGGVFSSADGVFALIFGWPLIALLFGSKPLSPFGLVGMLARSRIYAAVQELYPSLKKEVNEGGIASFLKDTAVDLAILDSSKPKEETPDDDPEEQGAEDNMQLRLIESRDSSSSNYTSLAQVDHS
ncbi:hypothetical protein PLICRDRAFT_125111 [Plicaturopsis crispa FD-325 SS-3]|nr:hypothetical protein PLICRDRAFT_125111 [Plicaturopsis crispa FD-325 SS-3]